MPAAAPTFFALDQTTNSAEDLFDIVALIAMSSCRAARIRIFDDSFI
ncbi:hypothetical protein [Tardiphaga sp. 839_C3_N1_4]